MQKHKLIRYYADFRHDWWGLYPDGNRRISLFKEEIENKEIIQVHYSRTNLIRFEEKDNILV